MSATEILTGERVLRMAMELELTGQVFYEVAAWRCGRNRLREEQLLLRLAADEERHYLTFREMLGSFLDRTGREAPPLSERLQHRVRKLFADRIVPDPVNTWERARLSDVLEVLDLAVETELESVGFYADVLLEVTGDEDRAVLERIIDEESTHASELLKARNALVG